MTPLDGRTLTAAHELSCDVVVVGSGPAGATVAKRLSEHGISVVVVEAGSAAVPGGSRDALSAMDQHYVQAGAAAAFGSAAMPFVQGVVLGGTSVINGAICWRLPEDVYQTWVNRDPQMQNAIPWTDLERHHDVIEKELNIQPTPEKLQGLNSSLLATGAEALGIDHRAIRRNVRDCLGSGECLQGCARGRKLSMDASYLPQAETNGAQILTNCWVYGLRLDRNGAAIGVDAGTPSGVRVRVNARVVVLAASAVGTPALLLRNRLRHGPVGQYFSCHPGASVSGRFDKDVLLWRGATQGHEVTGMRRERLKFESLGYDVSMAAIRVKGVGNDWVSGLDSLRRYANWGVALKARSHGRVRVVAGKPFVTYSLSRDDLNDLRRGVAQLGRMMLAAGAESVQLGVVGAPAEVQTMKQIQAFESHGPLDARAYQFVATHLFGTCRMGSDAGASVVGLDFQHHRHKGLFVADSSVFPSNIGVNPQIPIMAMAGVCSERIAKSL